MHTRPLLLHAVQGNSGAFRSNSHFHKLHWHKEFTFFLVCRHRSQRKVPRLPHGFLPCGLRIRSNRGVLQLIRERVFPGPLDLRYSDGGVGHFGSRSKSDEGFNSRVGLSSYTSVVLNSAVENLVKSKVIEESSKEWESIVPLTGRNILVTFDGITTREEGLQLYTRVI